MEYLNFELIPRSRSLALKVQRRNEIVKEPVPVPHTKRMKITIFKMISLRDSSVYDSESWSTC